MLTKNKNITIAILPFQITSDEERIKNLFTGFVDDLITSFSKFIGLSVVSSYSTDKIKDLSNQEEIDRLGADYLIFGRVRYYNEDIRISLQLIKNEDQNLVFGNQYDFSMNSLLSAQDDIVQQIVTILEEKINYNLLSYSYKKNTVDLAAYENYLIGMSILKKGSKDNDIKAREYFNAALKIDPNYSLAYTGLSLSYFNFWSCVLWERWDKSMEGAHKYALKAIELHPNDYIALGVLGRTYVYMEEWEKAEHYLRKSLRMNPNDCSHLLRVAYSLMLLGYPDEALKLYHRSIKLNPYHGDEYYAHGCSYYLANGDFKTSIQLAKQTSLNYWTDFPAHVAASYLQLQDYENVWIYWKKYLDLFKEIVYSGKKPMEEEACDWLLLVNPYKKFTYLSPLVDFVRSEKGIKTKDISKKQQAQNINSFHQNGEVWYIQFSEQSATLIDVKGFHDIQKLLSEPNKKFHCLDLMDASVYESHSIESIDQKTKKAYENRIKELSQELDEAELSNQIEKTAALREEYDTILEQLTQSLGLSGKARKVGSTVEKARSAVTWRIRNGIKKIGQVHPELAKHLSSSIKTGTYCSYSPELDVNWTL